MGDDDDEYEDRLVPVMAVSNNKTNDDVILSRLRHSFDLGFAITYYHKVQGQTLNEVVLMLHHRKSKQLLSLCFEMLYVALTRVRKTSDIRILYFNESAAAPQKGKKTTSKDINPGLHHLLHLKRPKHFDAWLAAYNNNGNWDDEVLKVNS